MHAIEPLAVILSPGTGKQLIGLALLVCGVGLVLTHLVIAGRRIERLNDLLAPKEQFDPAKMREQFWQFERMFRAKLPNDKSIFLEIGCLAGATAIAYVGLALLIPNIFR